MFDNVRGDIHEATTWHPLPTIRRLLGKEAEKVAVVFVSQGLQVVLIYRLQAWARKHHIPLLPGFCRRLTMILGSVWIGDPPTIGPGLLIVHGNVTIDGYTTIGPLCQIAPYVTIGLDTGGPDPKFAGPTIGEFVFIGTGAKILGPVTIGDNARIGANAVVMCDVPENSTAVGVPARVIPHEGRFGPARRD